MLKLSQPNISEAAISAVADVLRSGQLVHGPEGEAFEKELAAYLDCRDVVLVSSGTAALHVALLALDIGPGDAVIVPDFTFPATANAVALTGARPVIVDVLPGTYTLDVARVERVVCEWQGPERLRAVMPVHEFGSMVDMPELLRLARTYGLVVVEDAACALGASLEGLMAGAWGDLACFSFHPRKTLTTGEGGAVSTNDAVLATRLRRLRNHGMERTDAGMRFIEPSTNYRLTNFQAALGRMQLQSLDAWIAQRRELARSYLERLTPLAQRGLLDLPLWSDGHSWQTFMVVLGDPLDRAGVVAALRDHGVEANLGAQSLSAIGIYAQAPDAPVQGPRLFSHGLALPLFEQMTTADVDHVVRALSDVLERAGC